jgi:PAS domain S-box-containing protein
MNSTGGWTAFTPFYPAVLVSSMYGGTGPGLLATGLSALASSLLIEPYGRLSLGGPAQAVAMGVFLIVDLVLVLLCHQLRAAQHRADVATAARCEADRQVADVLAAVTDCFCAVDGQWRFTYVNPQAEAYFGRTRAELIGQNHWDVLHPRMRGTRLELELRQAMAERRSLEFELPSVLRPGRWVEVRAYPAPPDRLAAGADGLSIYFRDVTERHEAAERLAANERQLRLITDAAPVFISYIDSAGVYRFNNRRYADWFGIPREQITGRTVADVMGPANYQAARDPLQAALAGEHVVYERFHRDRAGVERWMKAEYVPDRDEGGAVRGLVCVVVDETDRRRALEEARRSEESYRSFITHSTEGIWRFELDQPIPTEAPVRDQIDAFYAHAYLAECNDAMARMYGFSSASELAGARLGDLLPRRDPHNVEYLAAFIRAGYRLADAESHEVDRDGNERVFVNNLTGIVEDGRLVRAWGTQRDATEQKRAEGALRRSEADHRAIFEMSSSGAAQVDPVSGRFVRVNRKLCEITGYSADELLSMTFSDLTHPDERERDMAAYQALLDGARTEWQMVKRYVRKDRQVIWVDVAGTVIRDEAGRPARTVGIIRDVTERVRQQEALRESEERLRLALDAGQCGVWDWEIPENRVTWSPRVYEFHGLTPETFGGTLEEFAAITHPDDQARVSAAVRRAVDEREPYHMEFRILRPTGEVRWLSTNGRVLYDEQGRPVRMLGATIDVTDAKAAEQERDRLLAAERSARADAESANRTKDEFLATLSHELRTPLNAMLGWAEILRSGAATEEDFAHGLESISRNAKAQAQIVGDLLDMSRIISGKVRLDLRPLDLAAVVAAAADTVRPAAEAKQIHLEVVAGPHAGRVNGDPERLQQVVWNLLSNAVKFTPAGGSVRAEVRPAADSPYGPAVEVAIIDSGEGIRPEFLPHVFERFRQADASTTRRHGGLGLGLAIAKHLVELHGGTIFAHSDGHGRGATFTVTLPARAALGAGPGHAHPPASSGASSADSAARVAAAVRGLRVLIVDDDPDARDLVRRILERCEAQVTAAGSAAEALNLLSAFTPDVLLSDIGMPDQDGFDLIRSVRAMAPHAAASIPAAALTAFARPEDAARAVGAGYQAHIPKPVEPPELLAIVADLAGKGGNGSA